MFSSPSYYRVQTTHGQELGVLEQGFVDQLVEQMSSFLLAGRAWTVMGIDHAARIVRVTAAPGGKRPSWGGFAPQFLGFELCQKEREILAGDAVLPYLHPSAAQALGTLREEFAGILALGLAPIVVEDGGARWWTFAGARVNYALAAAISYLRGWSATAENWMVKVQGADVTDEAMAEVLAQMRADGFWEDPAVYRQLLERLPQFRLSKFQRAMPDGAVREMVGRLLVDARTAAHIAQ